MPQPASISNLNGKKIDTIYLPDGTPMVKTAVGVYAAAGDAEDGAGQIAGTHIAGQELLATDALTLAAGVDGTVGDNVRPFLTDGLGRQKVITHAEPDLTTGLSAHKTISAATTNSTNVKASAGKLYSIFCNNQNAAVRFLKLYNKASAPTVGTDVPVMTLAIPPGGTVNIPFGPIGLSFSAGISFALTGLVADADTTAVSLGEHVVNLAYA